MLATIYISLQNILTLLSSKFFFFFPYYCSFYTEGMDCHNFKFPNSTVLLTSFERGNYSKYQHKNMKVHRETCEKLLKRKKNKQMSTEIVLALLLNTETFTKIKHCNIYLLHLSSCHKRQFKTIVATCRSPPTIIQQIAIKMQRAFRH